MRHELAKRENDKIETVDERPTVRPVVDIYENADEYLVVADLPAVSRDNLNIHIADSQLVIEATVSAEQLENAIEREFHLVNYRRSFELPEFVDRNKVQAKLR